MTKIKYSKARPILITNSFRQGHGTNRLFIGRLLVDELLGRLVDWRIDGLADWWMDRHD